MKKLIFAIISLVLLVACAVSASASEAPVKMEITAQPEKLVYTSADAVERTQRVWNEASSTVSEVTYSYYPVNFAGLEITFTYADDTTKVFSFDECMSLTGSEFTILNKTVQNAQEQWKVGNNYNVVLAYGDLTARYSVRVAAQLPDTDITVTEIAVAEKPEKYIYLDTEAYTATGFNENGEVVQYKAYPFTADGLLLQVTCSDGSMLCCTPAVLAALTGNQVIFADKQGVGSEWGFGAHLIDIVCGALTAHFEVFVDVKDHKLENYFYAGDNMHEVDCDYCGQTFCFNCEGGEATCTEKAVCTVCKGYYGEPLPHETYYITDADGHMERCNNCDLDGASEPHEFAAGEFDKDKKQALYTCSVCKYSVYGYPKGDMNSDGELTASDARMILRASVGLDTLNEQQTALADVDWDNELDAADARLVLRASVGLEKVNTFIPVTKES